MATIQKSLKHEGEQIIYLLDEIKGSHLKEQVFSKEINSSACLRTMHQKGYCGILAPVELEFATGTASKLSSLHSTHSPFNYRTFPLIENDSYNDQFNISGVHV